MKTDSGFAAFGNPVPPARKSRALAHLRDMAPTIDTDSAMRLIDGVAHRIERDDPYDALHFATSEAWPLEASSVRTPRTTVAPVTLDVTGGYRLLAVLCTDPD